MAVDILPAITFFATLLGLGVLVSNFTKKWKLPNAFFMLLIGLLLGPTFLNLIDVNLMGDVPEFLRTLALIVIVFAAAFHLKLDVFKKVSRISLLLAFGGFFFSTILLAIASHWLFSISWVSSFILGSIIGGSSSAAIVTFRSALEKEKNVFDILVVESIFTDPLTVLVPILILGYLVGTVTTTTAALSQFWQLITAGIGTGVVIGFIAVELFKKTHETLSPILAFAIAMFAYAAATNVGGSGVLAVAIAAIIIGNNKIPFREDIVDFDDSLSVMLNISIFTLLGAQVFLTYNSSLFLKEAIFIALLVLLIRPVYTVFALSKSGLQKKEKIIIAFTGPRGAAAAAIAAIPLSVAVRENIVWFIPEAELILITTFLVILFSLLFSTLFDLVYAGKIKEQYAKKRVKGNELGKILDKSAKLKNKI